MTDKEIAVELTKAYVSQRNARLQSKLVSEGKITAKEIADSYFYFLERVQNSPSSPDEYIPDL